jgi:hypothetical protein
VRPGHVDRTSDTVAHVDSAHADHDAPHDVVRVRRGDFDATGGETLPEASSRKSVRPRNRDAGGRDDARVRLSREDLDARPGEDRRDGDEVDTREGRHMRPLPVR